MKNCKHVVPILGAILLDGIFILYAKGSFGQSLH